MIDTGLNEKNSNREILIAFLTLAWPTVLEQFLSTILQYVDTAMVGWLGAEATATVSLSSTYTWLINSVVYAFGVGFLSYIARAIGEKDSYKVRHAGGQAALMVLVTGGFLTIVTQIAAPFMPGWMGADPSIRRDASIYFAVINLPLILRASMTIFGAVLRSTGDTKTPMKVNVLMNLVNVGLNAVFIYLLGMGAVGAGIATAISYSVGGILMTRAFFKNPILEFKPAYIKPETRILKDSFQVAIPLMLTQIASCGGYIVAASFVSSMETTIYAAHSIAITAEQLFYIPGYGMQAAASTLIGNAIGEGNLRKERVVIRYSLTIIFLIMCVTGTALYLGAGFMMSLFTGEAAVITIGTGLLRIVAFTEPIFGSAAVMDGIYAGLGNTRYPLAVELVSRWGVRILGSWILIHIFSGGIRQVWYAMITDNITKAALLAIGLLVLLRAQDKKTQTANKHN